MTDLPEKKMVHIPDVPDVKVDMKSEDVSPDPSSSEMPKVRICVPCAFLFLILSLFLFLSFFLSFSLSLSLYFTLSHPPLNDLILILTN